MIQANSVNGARRIFSVVFGACALFSSAAQAGQPAIRDVDSESHCSFVAPSGWVRKSDMPKPYTAFLGPIDQGFRSNISIYCEPTGERSLEQYVRTARDTIKKTNGMKLKAETKTVVGGGPAELLISSVIIPGHPAAETRQTICIHDKLGYIFTLTTAPGMAKKYVPAFDKMVSTVRWIK